MAAQIDPFRQEFETATQHLDTLRQHTGLLPDQQGAPRKALDGLTAILVRLEQVCDNLAQQNEAWAARCEGLEKELSCYRDASSSKRAGARDKLLAQVEQDRQSVAELAADLEQERDILRTLMENTDAQLAYLDTEFNFVQVNSAYVQGCGHRREELIGRNHFELFPDAENQAIFERVRDTRQPVCFQAKPFEYPDQPERGVTYWDWTLVPVLDTVGEAQGLVLSLADVTHQAHAAQERERLLAENRAQREFLERLLEAAPVGIAVLRGKDHRYELANPCYRTGTTGSVDTPMVGRTIVEVIPDLAKRRMPELMDEVYRTGQTVSTREVQLMIGPEGKETYWNTERVPLRGPDGVVEGILVLAQDVTAHVLDRRRIEALSVQAQRQADEKEVIFTSLVEPLMVLDTGGAILRANPAAVEALGVDPVGLSEPVLAKQMEVRYPDGRPIPADDLVAARALDGERVQDEYQILMTESGERTIVVSGAPIVTDGEISGAVVTWHDITDLQEAEEALRESKGKLGILLELMPVGISVLDEERRITHTNAALMQIQGLSREALLRGDHQARTYLRSDGTVMPLDEFPSVRAWQDQKPVRDQVGIVKEDGAVTWTDVSAAPVPFSDWKVVVAMIDVTERKQIEQALRQAHTELETRIQERTAELEHANEMLLAEIRQRMRIEGDLRLSEQRLEQRIEERTRELTTLLDISNTVALSIDLESLLALILERLKDVVDYDGAVAFRLEADTLNPVFHRGAISADDLLQIGSHLEEAVVGRAAIPGVERVILDDVQGEPALWEAFRQATGAKPPLSASVGVGDMADAVRAWMAVPVTIKQQVYGVLYMYHSHPGRYTEEQARLALPFGNQAAVAIENARIYEQGTALAALEERQRLAHDLHDAVTQTLFSASLAAEVLPRLWERDRKAGLHCLSEVQQLTRGALAEMRTLLLELRPAALVETALGALLDQLAQAIASRARIPVTVNAEVRCTLAPEVQVALYRIAQEALNNAAKHAGARSVEVRAQCIPPCPPGGEPPEAIGVELVVADDGRGFDPDHLPGGSRGLGLGIMRERAAGIGAALQIQSQAGQGTCIAVRWPAGVSE